MYLLVAGALAIVYLFPLLTKAVPSALVAIIVMTILSMAMHLDLRTVGDMGQISQALPFFHIPKIQLSLEVIRSILLFFFALLNLSIRQCRQANANGGTRRRHVYGLHRHIRLEELFKMTLRQSTSSFSSSHVWDHSTVTAIAKTMLKYQQIDKIVTIVGLNKESRKLVEQVGLAVSSGH